MGALNAATGISSLLLEKVRKTVEDGIEKKDKTFGRIEKAAEQLSTNPQGVRMPVQVEDNASEKWSSSEGVDFAATDAEVYKNLTVTYTRVYKSAEFTGDVTDLDKDPDKIGPIIGRSIASATKKLRKSLNRHVMGDGSGEIGRYSSGTGTTTITFTSTSGNYFGSRKFDKRQRIQFYDSTLATARNSGQVFTVSSVDKANKQVVLDAAPTLSANDVAVPEGSVSSVINGLGNIISNSGSIHGLSRSTYPALNCAVIAAGGAALSASLLDQLSNTMAYKTGEEKPEGMTLIWSPAQRQGYLNLGYELKQFPGAAGKLDLSFEGMTHANIPFLTDVDCPNDTVFMANLSQLKRFQLRPMGPFLNAAGGILHQRNASSGQGHADASNVYIGGKLQVGAPSPKDVGGKLTGLAVSGLPQGHDA